MHAVDNRANPFQVGIPAAAGYIMGVTDVVPVSRCFPTKITGMSHEKTP